MNALFPSELPQLVKDRVASFVATAQQACGAQLQSIVLFGSAAEGRLRATSDVNIMLLLERYDTAQIDTLREALRLAFASIQLNVMFVLASEMEDVSEAFAEKFADMRARHVVLHGSDPFLSLKISREATLRNLRQMLLNLTLRLRERYAMVSLREEQLVKVMADIAGPLRTAAASLLFLQTGERKAPKEALQQVARQISAEFDALLATLSDVREGATLKAGEGVASVKALLLLLQHMHHLTIAAAKG